MSSKFSLQSPYVVAALPSPIDHSNGRYVVGEVFGGAPGLKKRKRSELAVGVDGEGVNLYDISTSRLITSYALPPQSSFTCAPASLRTKLSKNKVQRRTYTSTTGPEPLITLFSEFADGPFNSSSTKTQKAGNAQDQVVFLGTITAARGSDVTEESSDLLVVRKNGRIQCLNGENLQEKWTSSPSALQRESAQPAAESTVEFVHLTNAYAASQGILKGRQDVFTIFPQEIIEDGFNPDVLFIITKSVDSRTIHVVTLPRRSAGQSNGLKRSVDSLWSVVIPSKSQSLSSEASFSLQASTGILQQLCNGRLSTYDLTDTIPKELSQIRSKHAKSFLRLSNTATLVSSGHSLSVYNPKFQSILASAQLDGKPSNESLKRKRGEVELPNGVQAQTCCLISYFPKLGTAVGISDNNLIGIQIEGKGRGGAAGLLIDSLGCAIPGQSRRGRVELNEEKKQLGLTTMNKYLPGPLVEEEGLWDEQIKSLEEAFTNGDVAKFDSLMAGKLNPSSQPALVNGFLFEDKLSVLQSNYAETVDRRWIIYALSKLFDWSRNGTMADYKLSISFYPPSTLTWLLQKGHVTISNIESALKGQIQQSSVEQLPSGALIGALVEIDEELHVLYALLPDNFLDAAELLSAIRYLMNSLDLVADNSQARQMLLTNGEDLDAVNGDVDELVKKLEADAEAELELAEYHLGARSGLRAEALSLALKKLYTCPNSSIVQALQTTFSIQEVVALIHLLRFELARGAWTTRYMDAEHSEVIDEDDEIDDNSIVLIATLLNSCVDAVGAGGWLSGDVRLVNGDPFEAEELISSLKLEVSAALEGVQEAVYLRGLTSEMIRYGDAVQGGVSAAAPTIPGNMRASKPVLLPSAEHDMTTLPLGLKADQQISLLKVGAGGEIHERSRRDIGHLKSQKVGKYSLERIII